LRLGTACTGLDIQEGAMRVHLLIEHALELETAHVRLEGLSVRFDGASGCLVVLALGQLQQLRSVGNAFARPINLFYGRSEPCTLATQLLCALLVRPDGRVFELTPDLLQPFFLLVVLKETPVGR